MRFVRCNLCNADDSRFLFCAREKELNTGDYFKLVKCRGCGLVYVNPRPNEKELREYYKCNMWPRAGKGISLKEATISGEKWNKVMAFRAKPILRYKKAGRILDYGCGEGYFLKYMKEINWDTYGFEIEERAASYARTELDLENIFTPLEKATDFNQWSSSLETDVREQSSLTGFTGKLEEARYPERFFDVINLHHVLEHLDNPSEILGRLKSFLKDGGLLVITVPNFGGIESRIFRDNWFALMVPGHLYQFSANSLKAMVEKQGFKILSARHISYEGKDNLGYSESIRYLLKSHRLFPFKGKRGMADSIKRNGKNFAIDLFHFFENILYRILGFTMDKLSLGGAITICAKKEE